MARHINESNWMNGSIQTTRSFEKSPEPQGSHLLAYQLMRNLTVR